ncbi:hypothetical protein V5O48_013672, partial [Marasmius crinis-equi]
MNHSNSEILRNALAASPEWARYPLISLIFIQVLLLTYAALLALSILWLASGVLIGLVLVNVTLLLWIRSLIETAVSRADLRQFPIGLLENKGAYVPNFHTEHSTNIPAAKDGKEMAVNADATSSASASSTSASVESPSPISSPAGTTPDIVATTSITNASSITKTLPATQITSRESDSHPEDQTTPRTEFSVSGESKEISLTASPSPSSSAQENGSPSSIQTRNDVHEGMKEGISNSDENTPSTVITNGFLASASYSSTQDVAPNLNLTNGTQVPISEDEN